MSVHVYMSQQPVLAAGTRSARDLFNYRGEVGPTDDPQGFVRRMGDAGYEVVLAAKGPGPAVKSPTGRVNIDHWRGIPRASIPEAALEN